MKKNDLKKSKEEVQEILKEYIRKFMKNTDYQKHFEPTITKIINDYNLISSNGEPNIENLIKLHLPSQKSNNSASNTESTYYKSRAGSNETRKQPSRIPASSPSDNLGKKSSNNKQLKIKLKLKKENEPPCKINLKIAGDNKERQKENHKGFKKAGLVTRREWMGTKKIQHEIPQRGKSEEQRLNDLIMNESEQEDKYDPEEGIIEEREKLVAYNKRYFKEHNNIPSTTLEYYRYVKVIGVGAFGVATLGIHKLTGKYVAIKTIKKSLINDEYSKSKLFLEIYVLKKIQHSNIIRLLEVFESMKHILLVMEYANGGDLLHFVRSYGKLPELDSKYIFRQILYGLAHWHCRSVMHRDIKLDNILIDSNGNIKIWDFGIAKIIGKGDKAKEQCGTPAYMAPEIMNENGYDAFYPDFWSLGVLLFTLLFGTVPFKAQWMEELHALIQKGEFAFPPGVSQEAQNLIERLIVVNPKQRITIPEILSHPWFKEIWEDDSDSSNEDDEEKDTLQQKIEHEIEARK